MPKTSPEGTTIGGIVLRIADRCGAEIWRILGEKVGSMRWAVGSGPGSEYKQAVSREVLSVMSSAMQVHFALKRNDGRRARIPSSQNRRYPRQLALPKHREWCQFFGARDGRCRKCLRIWQPRRFQSS
jgi:hypothetical protein